MALPILGPIIDIVGKVIDKSIADPKDKMQLTLELAKLQDMDAQRAHQELMGQIDTNKVEATHRSVFVAGWRPAIGWVGALSLFMYYPVQIAWQLVEFGAVKLDVTDLLAIIAGLLGFGGLRSFDKVKGVANDAVFKPVAQPAPEKKKGPKILPDWLR